jgi:hypothetical protein
MTSFIQLLLLIAALVALVGWARHDVFTTPRRTELFR